MKKEKSQALNLSETRWFPGLLNQSRERDRDIEQETKDLKKQSKREREGVMEQETKDLEEQSTREREKGLL